MPAGKRRKPCALPTPPSRHAKAVGLLPQATRWREGSVSRPAYGRGTEHLRKKGEGGRGSELTGQAAQPNVRYQRGSKQARRAVRSNPLLFFPSHFWISQEARETALGSRNRQTS